MLGPDDEPLSHWYADRDQLRRPVGTRDALVLDHEPRPGGHPIFKDVPRLVVEWDGQAWQPVAVAGTYAAAYQMIAEHASAAFPQASTPVPLLRTGTGRHRRR